MNATQKPFAVKDCALIALATGRRAQNLRELGMQLAIVSAGSIYYHFWGGLLRPGFDDPEYMNDFRVLGPTRPPRQAARRAARDHRPHGIRQPRGAAPRVDRCHRGADR